MVDEASLRIFSSVSKDDRAELDHEDERQQNAKGIIPHKSRLDFSDSDAGSEKLDYVATRDKLGNLFNEEDYGHPPEEDDYRDQLNMSDFFVQKDYKGIRARRSTIQPYAGKKQYQTSRSL